MPANRTGRTSPADVCNGNSGRIKSTPNVLFCIDETWAKTNMKPIRGRWPVGQRLVAKVPHDQRKTLTFVAALRCDGICAPCLLERAGVRQAQDYLVNSGYGSTLYQSALVPTLMGFPST
jgi:hypothetical protein